MVHALTASQVPLTSIVLGGINPALLDVVRLSQAVSLGMAASSQTAAVAATVGAVTVLASFSLSGITAAGFAAVLPVFAQAIAAMANVSFSAISVSAAPDLTAQGAIAASVVIQAGSGASGAAVAATAAAALRASTASPTSVLARALEQAGANIMSMSVSEPAACAWMLLGLPEGMAASAGTAQAVTDALAPGGPVAAALTAAQIPATPGTCEGTAIPAAPFAPAALPPPPAPAPDGVYVSSTLSIRNLNPGIPGAGPLCPEKPLEQVRDVISGNSRTAIGKNSLYAVFGVLRRNGHSPRRGVYFQALSARLRIACNNLSRSAVTMSLSSSSCH